VSILVVAPEGRRDKKVKSKGEKCRLIFLVCSWVVLKFATLFAPRKTGLSVFNFHHLSVEIHELKGPDNENEALGDILRPPHKHLKETLYH